MAVAIADTDVGAQVRRWRDRRRMTQLELALEAGTSARHLSFVETGRAKPGREMLLRVLEGLDVPYRERNELLLAAGHAPALPERSLDDPALAPVRDAMELTLASHEPNPGIAVDRHWNIVAANAAVAGLAAGIEVDPALLGPPVNAITASLHPRGLGPLIVNVGAWREFFRERLARQLASTGDTTLAQLIDELERQASAAGDEAGTTRAGLPGPLRMRTSQGGELAFISMFASFDYPFEVTTSELALELLFPADAQTAEAMEDMARQRAAAPR